jgi:hypothetical protein
MDLVGHARQRLEAGRQQTGLIPDDERGREERTGHS